jgi:hypothetical protein
MMTIRHALALAPLALGTLVFGAGCELLGSTSGGLSGMACPELRGGDALSAQFSVDARANGKVRAFVQAAQDLTGVSVQAEAEIAEACTRMGQDLGLPPQAMAAKNEPGGRASGACANVAARIDAILRAGAGVQVQVTPPSCQASADAGARCSASCGAQGQAAAGPQGAAAGGDAECAASCRAHADIHASCSPALVVARPTAASADAARLAATLQANLPLLLHAQIALGKRVLADAQVVGQVGAALPKIVGQAGARALACIGAAAEATASASARLNVSVQASASVSGRVGAGG